MPVILVSANCMAIGAIWTRLKGGVGKLAVIGVDLDRFKEINDTFGHVAGDDVLKTIADRLVAICHDNEFVARIGGDEFGALKPFDQMSELKDFLERIENAVAGPLFVGEDDGWASSVGASLGVAIYPDDGKNQETLTANADLAMYAAKGLPDRSAQFYEPRMLEASQGRLVLGRALYSAIKRDCFYLRYVQQISMGPDSASCFGAFAYWSGCEREEYSLSDHINIAEQCGAILPIGDWMLRTACNEASSFPSPSRLAVRLSPAQFIHANLPELVQRALAGPELRPDRLELDVPQSVLVSNKERVMPILRQLASLGVGVAIADFDGGYSSVDLLKSFPFSSIKLAGSRVVAEQSDRRLHDVKQSIISLGLGFGLPVYIRNGGTLTDGAISMTIPRENSMEVIFKAG